MSIRDECNQDPRHWDLAPKGPDKSAQGNALGYG